MKKYKERWNALEWYEKILIIPGLSFAGLISIILLPLFLFFYIINLTIEFFEDSYDSNDLFY